MFGFKDTPTKCIFFYLEVNMKKFNAVAGEDDNNILNGYDNFP